MLPKMRFGSRGARPMVAAALLLMIASACATGHMWTGMTMPEHNKSTMYYEPGTSASWLNYVGAVLLAPVTLAIDIILFPVQVVGGYWPYGEKDPP